MRKLLLAVVLVVGLCGAVFGSSLDDIGISFSGTMNNSINSN
jgi:hypothetical protein